MGGGPTWIGGTLDPAALKPWYIWNGHLARWRTGSISGDQDRAGAIPGLVPRPRLLAILSELPAKRLGVIKAPAGFGKSSLAAAWAEKLEQSGNCVGWLTIDPDDDEATRFLFYVSQALHHACPDVGAGAIGLILENNLIDPTAILSSLINDLAEIEDDIYLFLEDYHWLRASRIHQTVAYFLKHAPSHCHVVLTTRAEPALPLATLRAQNQLIEIDALALRFDMQETKAFLDSTKPGVLELPDVQLLQRKTEGWPAALRIISSMPSQSGFRPEGVCTQSLGFAASNCRLFGGDVGWASGGIGRLHAANGHS